MHRGSARTHHGNRQSARQLFFSHRELSRLSARARGLSGLRADARFAHYLEVTNLRVLSLDDSIELIVKIAQFSDITMAHVKSPRAEVVWPRDRQSRGRVALIVGKHGEVRAIGEGVPVQDSQVVFIPPGEHPVRFEFPAPFNEFVYVSFPTAVIADIPLSTPLNLAGANEIEPALVDPIYRFVTGLAHAPVREDRAESLRFAAVEMVRALVHLVLKRPDTELTLFERAIEAMKSDLGNPNINADSLAAKFHVSARRLQLEFQERGTTVQRELRRLRTAAVRRSRRLNPGADIMLLARAFGFGSKSAVYRALSEESERSALG
jgi:AraC-like DNA-binding protein